MPAIFKNHHAYSKMDIEDPEDRSHRRAQFLIYKTLQEAVEHRSHTSKKKNSYISFKLCNVRVKVGKRIKKLKNSLYFNVSLANIGVCRQVAAQLNAWRKLLGGQDKFTAVAASALPRPLFTV